MQLIISLCTGRSTKLLDNLVRLYHAVELGHIEVFHVAKARWAVRLVAEHAEEALLVAGHDSCASKAFYGLIARVRTDHTLTSLELVARLEPIHALRSHAQSKSLLGSAQSHQMFSEELENVSLMAPESSNVLGLKALVVLEFTTDKLLSAQLALDHDFGAVTLDVLEQLSTSHVLVLFLVANVAAVLGALNHGVLLQLEQSLPDDLTVLAIRVASMRELAEVNAVTQYLVDVGYEVATFLAVGAAHVIAGRRANIRLRVLRAVGRLTTVARR